MRELAWSGVIDHMLDPRVRRPRSQGLTMVIDTGTGPAATADTLEIAGAYIDFWKCSFGTSAFMRTSVLKRKLDLLAARGILTFPGGTLLEAALVQCHCRVFMSRAKELGFTAVEISDGTVPMPIERRQRVIQCGISAGLTVITEVGKKDPNDQPSPRELAELALHDLEWGAEWVIVEGRESGIGVGIYDDTGAVLSGKLEEIVEIMGEKANRLIWEAPIKIQQAYLIDKFGANVNLGNIPPEHILALEALRSGLRFETLAKVAKEMVESGRWDPTLPEPTPEGKHGQREEGKKGSVRR
jgi:phosphosulfolactate synthase